jgi:predicted nucleic acid-binding protein
VPGLVYCDSSALVKLVVAERESGALQQTLRNWSSRVSSVVTPIEVLRAARRGADPEAVARAEELLARLDLVDLDAPIRRAAASIEPPALRSLDAIHLATALSVPDLDGFVVYDVALAQAAAAAGLVVVTPR